jgi:amino acid adenylation domain-containing protein
VQTLFNTWNYPSQELSLAGLRVKLEDLPLVPAQFDLELDAVEAGGHLDLGLIYNAQRFSRPRAQGIIGNLQILLETFAQNADEEMGSIPLSAGMTVVPAANAAAAAAVPLRRTFPELFSERALKWPERIAAGEGGERLTYQELDERAKRLAGALARRGVGPEAVIALLDRRGLDLLTAIVGIMKAGGAYLPLDPAHPPRRIAQLLTISRTPLAVVGRDYLPVVEEACLELSQPPRVVTVPDLLTDDRGALAPLTSASTPNNLAYVIFTSGSTGTPKGAMIEQRGMVNHLHAKIADLQLTADDVLIENASQCFDISVWQFLAPLLVGGRVEIVSDEVARDPQQLLSAVAAGATVLETVPSMLALLIDAAKGRPLPLRWMVATGEALPPELCRRWFQAYPDIPLVNAYGPTECSDDVTHHVMRESPAADERRIPIGRPILNTQIYVLDHHLHHVPDGVVGELYVGGAGVGRGYLHDSERTAMAFGSDPFAGTPGARLYRTGDLGRRRSDGTFEYLGRIDHQMKIRGMRLDLDEITAVLRQHPGVRDAIVVATGAEADQRLAAYVVLDAATPPGESALRQFLRERLPAVMIPAAFVFLDELPLTPNGKIDRRALPPAPVASAERESTYVAPRTPTEQTVAQVWCDILHVDRVGIHDDFFALGGHSIAAIRVQSRLRELLNVEAPLTAFFATPTVEKVAEALDARIAGRGASPDDSSVQHAQGPAAVVKNADSPDPGHQATPSEFPGTNLTQEELDEIMRRYSGDGAGGAKNG